MTSEDVAARIKHYRDSLRREMTGKDGTPPLEASVNGQLGSYVNELQRLTLRQIEYDKRKMMADPSARDRCRTDIARRQADLAELDVVAATLRIQCDTLKGGNSA